MIGVESKRFEPFRDTKSARFSKAYRRPVWGKNMRAYEELRDSLHAKEVKYKHLDAAQLIKHAFGLRTQANKRKLTPILVYVYVEKAISLPVKINQNMINLHRQEINDFAKRVEGNEVRFIAFSYADWLKSFTGQAKKHAVRLTERFDL